MNRGIQIFQYQSQEVEFDFSTPNLMVNATEMAKIFGRLPADFLRLDQTKEFVLSCLNYGISHNLGNGKTRNSEFLGSEKNGNSRFLGIEKESDLYVSRQRSGTWMHRILALKFAAWLDPEFELWVYMTIDEILFGNQREQQAKLSQAAKDELRRQELESHFAQNPEYCELQSLRAKKNHFFKETQQAAETQLKLFTGQHLEN